MNERGPAALALLLIAAALLLFQASGCRSGEKKPLRSPAKARATGLNNRAVSAFDRGDYEGALALFKEALAEARSIENADAVALNLVNIAAVYRRLADPGKAIESADEVLGAPHMGYPARRLAGAAEVKAMALIDKGDLAGAAEWSEKAASYCETSACGFEGRLVNLGARVAHLGGDHEGAYRMAALGLEPNRKAGDLREEANSLRLMADARSALGAYEEALSLYERALGMDKRLGLAEKVIADLMGAGGALLGLGRPGDALGYFLRARSASIGEGDEEGVRAASEMIEKTEGIR